MTGDLVLLSVESLLKGGWNMLQPQECTLYSGGHEGAEAFFGECAEKWGVREVTYSYEEHFIKRSKNVVLLTDEQLRQGDISMEIVTQHMHRQFHSAVKIRRVIQAIYHMLNNGSQVFAVGVILDDGTVKGGTGWGVELGKFLNRNVHVFDKEKHGWYTWSQGAWVAEHPVIMESTFCGTGSRYLTEESREAIAELFTKSFAK